MLTKRYRFHGHNTVNRAQQGARVARGPGISLKYSRNSRRRDMRVAVVVSKKVSKSAVVRNRIRRRIYEIVRQQVAPDQPLDLVFVIYNPELAMLEAHKLQQTLANLLRQTGAVLH